MASIDILGVPHTYELMGKNESPCALIFIHGWLLSRHYWQPMIDRLAADYQCLSYDLRGFGDSPIPSSAATIPSLSALPEPFARHRGGAIAPATPSPYTPAAYAKDLVLLLKQLNISRAWLVGHSLGGSIALWAAHLAPEVVQGVVCINAGGGIYLKEEFERFRHAGEKILKFRHRWLPALPLVHLMMGRMNVARPVDRIWGRQRSLDFVSADLQAALGSLLDSTTEAEVHNLPRVVSHLHQPVYFIAGAQDTIMEPKYVRHLASFHPTFRVCGDNVIEIPDCGHLSMIEQPEAVVAQVRSILTRHTSQEPIHQQQLS
jgi:pimeloyl-ACP methyl ester carboxylesterase